MAKESTIQHYRGLEVDRTGVTPANGELLITTDNEELFLGDGSTAGGILIGGPLVKYSAGSGTYNGLCLVNQKAVALDAAAVAATHNEYPIDQHKTVLVGVTGTHQWLSTSQPVDINGYSLKYAAASIASGQIGSKQIVKDYARYAGLQVTRSRLVKSNSTDARLIIDDGTTKSASDGHTGGGGWELLTVTATINASPTKLECYAVIASSTLTNVSITVGDYIEFTDARLDLGSHRLSGDRTYQQELAECRRFWYQPNGVSTYQHHGAGIASTTGSCYIQIKHNALHAIADALVNSAISTLRLTDGVSGFVLTNLSIISANGSETITVLQASASGLTIGNTYHLTSNNDASAYIGLGNEL